MEPSMEIEAPRAFSNGKSLAHDLICGHTLTFEGIAHEESGPRAVWGNIHWSTFFSSNLGNKSIAGKNQRDVGVQFVTRANGGGFKQDPDGVRDTQLVAFDYDFMHRLLDRDPGAEAELVKIAESNPKRAVRYEVTRSGRS